MSEHTQPAARPSGAFAHVPTVRVGSVRWLTILMGWTLLMPMRSHVSAPWAQSPAWPPEGGFVAEAALDLQEAFEPWRWNTGPDAWTGGDVGASAPLNSNYTLWILETLCSVTGTRPVSRGSVPGSACPTPVSEYGVFGLGTLHLQWSGAWGPAGRRSSAPTGNPASRRFGRHLQRP